MLLGPVLNAIQDDLAAPSLSQTDHAEDTSNATSYSFAGLSIGAAAADRIVIATVHWGAAGPGATISSATIGGVTATIVQQQWNGSSGSGVAIIYAAVPTGTTATVVVNFTGVTPADCSVIVYRLTGQLSNTPRASAVQTTSPLKLYVPGKGVAVVAHSNPSAAVTPTNYTEDVDDQIGAEALYYESGHYADTSGFAQIRDFGVATVNVFAAASWR